MLKYLVLTVFILSVALAAGSIVLASRLRTRYRTEVFSSLLYFLVFIFTFGFYGIWGQVLIKAFLSPYIEQNLITRFSNISLLLGLPFLVFAWLMLMKFSGEISGKRFNNKHLVYFLLINFTIIITLGYLITQEKILQPEIIIRYYYISMNFIYSLIAAFLIYWPKKGKSFIHAYDRRTIATGLIIILFLQCVPLLLYSISEYIQIGFILAFFAGNSFLPVYFSYGTMISSLSEEPGKDLSFEEFCLKYEVSPRETDIVREICNGLSNKEIADKLFISLQTVKDHTHRIYIKTNVRSRVQLITLVKEEIATPFR
jgi:DNA-binding CsgD family transcriptional regulator